MSPSSLDELDSVTQPKHHVLVYSKSPKYHTANAFFLKLPLSSDI